MSADIDEERKVVVLGPGEGDVVGPTRILAQSPGDPIAVTESTIPPGFPGPVRHRHAQMYDIFYVLDGTLTLETERDACTPAGRLCTGAARYRTHLLQRWIGTSPLPEHLPPERPGAVCEGGSQTDGGGASPFASGHGADRRTLRLRAGR